VVCLCRSAERLSALRHELSGEPEGDLLGAPLRGRGVGTPDGKRRAARRRAGSHGGLAAMVVACLTLRAARGEESVAR
jgi:hypothetical protein